MVLVLMANLKAKLLDYRFWSGVLVI